MYSFAAQESRLYNTSGYDTTNTTALSAVLASYKCQAAAIVILTTSGASARAISKYRPICPIITVTRFPQVGADHLHTNMV